MSPSHPSRLSRPANPSRAGRLVTGVVLSAVFAAGCGSSKTVAGITTAAVTTVAAAGGGTSTSGPTTTAPATSSTSAAPVATTVAATTSTTARTSGPTTSGGPVSADAVEAAWALTAVDHRGQNGTRFTTDCPAGGRPHTVWGTETYTDDSSICTAAVHVGLVTVAKGGSVEYQIAPGADAYAGTSAHDVVTTDYGSWQGSFTFPAAPPGSGRFTVGPESWSKNASANRGKDGTRVTVACSPAGSAGSVWGSGPYTDDSSVCTAAVHSGLITFDKGGTVAIVIGGAQPSFAGTTAHGVTTNDYGSFDGSFTFPKDQPAA